MFIQSKTNWKFLAIVAALAVIVGGVIFCWQKNIPEPEFINLQNNQSETANWQTYRNEEYGFELKHPSDWNLYQSGEDSASYARFKFSYSGPNQTEATEPFDAILFNITISKNSDDLSLPELIAQKKMILTLGDIIL
jgi:hypothetical protein